MVSTSTGSLIPALRLSGVSKRFGGVQALDDVSVECRAGEIHAVLGENGSGKSTLLGVASGFVVPDEGAVEIGGHPLRTGNAAEALSLGLGMAYQIYAQVLDLSVAENLFLAAPDADRPPFRRMVSWATDWLAGFDITVSGSARMGALSLAERQLVEVAKALLSRPKVLLLDEPTTALGPSEVARLHELVVGRAAAGVGVVYVSHRLPEVLEISHRITVLRDGRSQGTHQTAGMSEDELISLMIGRSLEQAFPARGTTAREGRYLLEVAGLAGRRFGPLDLTLSPGEILGIAGAEGNGQDELLRCLAGVDRASGTIRCDGTPVNLKTPSAALRAGIVLLSGERLRDALFPVLGVRANSSAQVLRRFSRAGVVNGARERAAVQEVIRRLEVRTPTIEQPVRFLSGGNQQKVSLTRPFLRDAKVILANEPTQGVDVRSRFDIYEALRAKTDEGAGLIVKSSDPIELSGLCDRVIVISRGRIVDEISSSDLGERRITEAIVRSGGAPSSPGRVEPGEGSNGG